MISSEIATNAFGRDNNSRIKSPTGSLVGAINRKVKNYKVDPMPLIQLRTRSCCLASFYHNEQ